jgi:NAD(P)-dependent dehydrogenase (short-subunit alcohol dehydrogenase family)
MRDRRTGSGESSRFRTTTLTSMSSWTAADLPSFAGRTVIVTGANSGLGEATARELARVGARVILACRNLDKGHAAAAGMTGNVEVRKLDLQSLESVREFAAEVAAVDVLVNNAGIMAVPYATTADGFESQIGTNHLGHFALTNLLLPKIGDRVVTVASAMHVVGFISIKDLDWKARPYLPWPAYGQSKLANLLFTMELQRRLTAAGSPLKALAAHPGWSATNLQGQTGNRFGTAFARISNRLVATDAAFGARQTLYAASQDLPGNTYIGPRYAARGPSGPTWRTPLAKDSRKAQALWKLSEELTGTEFPL